MIKLLDQTAFANRGKVKLLEDPDAINVIIWQKIFSRIQDWASTNYTELEGVTVTITGSILNNDIKIVVNGAEDGIARELIDGIKSLFQSK